MLKVFQFGIGGIGREKAVHLLVGVLPVVWFSEMNRRKMKGDYGAVSDFTMVTLWIVIEGLEWLGMLSLRVIIIITLNS